MNIGRVRSKNAGAASNAVAMPALNAYFESRSLNLEPNAQRDCFSRPRNESCDRAGVCMVFGACGLTFGNQDACENNFSGRK